MQREAQRDLPCRWSWRRPNTQAGFHVCLQRITSANEPNCKKVTVMKIVSAFCRIYTLKIGSHDSIKATIYCSEKLKACASAHARIRTHSTKGSEEKRQPSMLQLKKITNSCMPPSPLHLQTHIEIRLTHKCNNRICARSELTEAATFMKNQFYLRDHQFCNLGARQAWPFSEQKRRGKGISATMCGVKYELWLNG